MVGGWGTFSPSSDGAEETFPPLLRGARRRANVGRGEDKNLNENKKNPKLFGIFVQLLGM